MKPNIDLSESSRTAVGTILNKLLSDEYVLYTKTRNFHWNVTGPTFHELHKFFEAQYDELNTIVDDVAERARALGVTSFGSLAEFQKNTRLKEQSGDLLAPKDMIHKLLTDHEALIATLRGDLEACGSTHKDAGTSDFLTGLMEQHEKMAWMLRSHLSG